MTDNTQLFMDSILNIKTQLTNNINCLPYRKQLESALYTVNQNLNTLEGLDINGQRADQSTINYRFHLQHFRTSILDGLRFQTQLYCACNEIKQLLEYFANFNIHGLDILCKVIKTKYFNKLPYYIEKYRQSVPIDDLHSSGLYDYIQSMELSTRDKLKANLNLNLNELQVKKSEGSFLVLSRVLPALGIFTVICYFGLSFSFSINPILKGGLTLTGSIIGSYLLTKRFMLTKESIICDVQERINAVTTASPQLEASNEAVLIQCQTISETNRELGLGLDKLFKGWESAKKALKESRNDPSLRHHSEERLIEMVKNLGCATNDIEVYYSVSRDQAWSMIEFLNSIEK